VSQYREVGGPPSSTTMETTEVKAGGSLPVGTSRYQVLNIVAPDPANGIMGWVDFNLTPQN
jgi:hypothetical protein